MEIFAARQMHLQENGPPFPMVTILREESLNPAAGLCYIYIIFKILSHSKEETQF
jgi:hypothetical protein